jgi:predicted metalloprotease
MPGIFGQQFVQASEFLLYEGELDPPDCDGQPLPPRNAAYCSGEGFVAFDVDWFLENMKSQAGDSSVYVILFHEWGHAVQDQIGGPSLGIAYELQADCYAGAALSAVVRSGQLQLEAGDAGEVISILFQLGDPAGTPWLDPDAHGSAEQRI